MQEILARSFVTWSVHGVNTFFRSHYMLDSLILPLTSLSSVWWRKNIFDTFLLCCFRSVFRCRPALLVPFRLTDNDFVFSSSAGWGCAECEWCDRVVTKRCAIFWRVCCASGMLIVYSNAPRSLHFCVTFRQLRYEITWPVGYLPQRKWGTSDDDKHGGKTLSVYAYIYRSSMKTCLHIEKKLYSMSSINDEDI